MITTPASSWGCSASDGCDFPAPGVDIFFGFDPTFSFTLFGVEFVFDKPMILLFLGVVVVVGFFMYAFRNPKIVPKGAQNIGELGYTFIRDGIVRENIGKGGEKFVPLLFSLFFFIWILNFMGVVPGLQYPVTSLFAIPVAFAAIVFFTWVPLGIMKQGPWGFFKNIMFPPGLPKPLYVLLAPIELISNIVVRPFTHCVRLFANMFAGHLLLVTFGALTWWMLSASVWILASALSFTVLTAMTGLELLIQGLQAYIFTLLTAVYLSDALSGEH